MHQLAQVLANPEDEPGAAVRARFEALLGEMTAAQATVGPLSSAVTHFLKVTASYQPGLFHCYDVPDLPRTNNDLEHYFGTARHQERRATGRKQASPGLVVRGGVRVLSSVATRHQRFSAADLQLTDRERWRELRRELETRHAARRAHGRFRRDPAGYLAALEAQLLQPGLPP